MFALNLLLLLSLFLYISFRCSLYEFFMLCVSCVLVLLLCLFVLVVVCIFIVSLFVCVLCCVCCLFICLWYVCCFFYGSSWRTRWSLAHSPVHTAGLRLCRVCTCHETHEVSSRFFVVRSGNVPQQLVAQWSACSAHYRVATGHACFSTREISPKWIRAVAGRASRKYCS